MPIPSHSSNQRAVWLFLATCARIWEPTESQSWGHVNLSGCSSQPSISVCACVICRMVPCNVRAHLGARESQSWGHVGSLETSSRVSKHYFPSKSNYCRCGHLGLQVARRRGFTGLEAALQFACFFGLAGRLRLFGAMLIPRHSGPSLCALAQFAVAS